MVDRNEVRITEMYKVHLSIQTRISFLISGIKELTQTWIWIANPPGHYEYYPFFGSMGRLDGFLGGLETAIVGYVWGFKEL